MNSIATYADLEIRILAGEERGFPIQLTLNREREFTGGYLDPTLIPEERGNDAADMGERLFEWLTNDAHVMAAWAEIRGSHPQRRIRLVIDEAAAQLHALPWETLRDASTDGPALDLAAADSTPFSRYLMGRWHPGSPILGRPIRILVAVSNPQNLNEYDLEPLGEEKEWTALVEATAELDVELVRLTGPCTLAAIADALTRRGCHILHFIGHGGYGGADGETAFLMMADEENRVFPVTDTQFAEMLARQLANAGTRQEDKLRLVFLASCESATRSPADAFRGLAPQLVAAGVPAVLAMQDLMPVNSARSFSQLFYQRLLDHGIVDLASNQARAMLLNSNQSGSAIPVLFLRLANGELLGRRGQILGDEAASFWRTLLDNIFDGECTPFLGSGVTAALLPTNERLAHQLTEEYHYPFRDWDNLPRVAQFVGTVDNRNLRKKLIASLVAGFKARMALAPDPADRRKTLSEVIEESGWSEHIRALLETEIHHQLANLNLPLYITTNFDNFMTMALQSTGRTPRRITVDWHSAAQKDAARPHFDLTPPPGEGDPVVLHLFGSDEDLLSMVLTEDDYLDYLARIAQDYEYLLPTSVNEALASTTLLFLGYRLEEIDLKVILRGLLTNLDLERWGMLHVAVQIESSIVDQDKQDEVIRYFQRYFGNSKIDVYWGSTQQFVADLYARWQEEKRG